MPNNVYSARALCPFYCRREDFSRCGGRISCSEGLVPGSRLTLTFSGTKRLDRHFDVFCCRHFSKCELYRAIVEAGYEEEGAAAAAQ